MKQVLVIIDGLSDDPISEIGENTPLEVAFIPNIHYIASTGMTGRIDTYFEGYPIESLVCNMALLGYDPRKYYPSGRASFEALAKGIPIKKDDLVLRCNIVSIKDGSLIDFTAGMISDSEARKIISGLNLPYKGWEIYPGQSYRNTLVIRSANISPQNVKCYEPHMNIGKSINDILPEPIEVNSDSLKLVEEINNFLLDSQEQIKKIETLEGNKEDKMLWVWSPSSSPYWPSYKKIMNKKAALVAGLDFFHGMAMAAGIHYDVIPNATGYIDTDYRKKAEYAINYLKDHDFVIVHVNAADEAAHARDWNEKIKAIESVDRYIMGPLMYELEKNYKDDYRIAVCGDHKTRCSDGKHIGDPVPFAFSGVGVEASKNKFTEKDCLNEPLYNSLEFLNKTLFRGE